MAIAIAFYLPYALWRHKNLLATLEVKNIKMSKKDINAQICALKKHGNVGNKNAKKHDDVAHIHFKTSMSNKTKWVAQAQKQGFKNLSEYIVYKVNL